MAYARLGNLAFRLDPTQIQYAYQLDYVMIDTVGGQVIQVLGATMGDITITGLFGQDHANNRASWQLAESFHKSIRQMMDNQVLPPNQAGAAIHQPIRFSYLDGRHNWDMKVLIKAISDTDGEGSIRHSNGKFSYGYSLTLFLVEDSSRAITHIAQDSAIARISTGVGWKGNTKFQGSLTAQDAIKFIQNASPSDPTFQGYLAGLFAQTAGGTQ